MAATMVTHKVVVGLAGWPDWLAGPEKVNTKGRPTTMGGR